jgi:hypothetical protein
MDIFVDTLFWVLVWYALDGVFTILDDVQKSPKWVEGYWKYEKDSRYW